MLDRFSTRMGARRASLRLLLIIDALYVSSCFVALVWMQVFHQWLGVESKSHIPIRLLLLTIWVVAYNAQFLSGGGLGMISCLLAGHVLVMGGHDLFMSSQEGGALITLAVESVVRLGAVALLFHIWMDDYFTRKFGVAAPGSNRRLVGISAS